MIQVLESDLQPLEITVLTSLRPEVGAFNYTLIGLQGIPHIIALSVFWIAQARAIAHCSICGEYFRKFRSKVASLLLSIRKPVYFYC